MASLYYIPPGNQWVFKISVGKMKLPCLSFEGQGGFLLIIAVLTGGTAAFFLEIFLFLSQLQNSLYSIKKTINLHKTIPQITYKAIFRNCLKKFLQLIYFPHYGTLQHCSTLTKCLLSTDKRWIDKNDVMGKISNNRFEFQNIYILQYRIYYNVVYIKPSITKLINLV